MLNVNGVCISFEEIKECLKNRFNVCCTEIDLSNIYDEGYYLSIKGDEAFADLFPNKKWTKNDCVYSNDCDLEEADNINAYNSKSVMFEIVGKIIGKKVIAYAMCIDLLKDKTDKYEQIIVFTE